MPCIRVSLSVCLVLVSLIFAGCDDSDNSGNSGNGSRPDTMRIEGVVDDGTASSPIAHARCRLEDYADSNITHGVAIADSNSFYRLDVQTDIQGVLLCAPPPLPRLSLSTFISTVGQAAGHVMADEDVTPASTIITEIILQERPSNPVDLKASLFADLAQGDSAITVLVEAATRFYKALLDADLDAGYGSEPQGEDVGDTDGGGVEGEAGDGAELSPLPGSRCDFALTVDGTVLASTVLADLFDNSRMDRPDLQVLTNAVVIQNSASLAQAYQTLFPQGIGRPLQSIADADGIYTLPIPPGVPGFVRCRPPEVNALELNTFVRARQEGEMLRGQDVTPPTTVVSVIVREFQMAHPSMDSAEVKTDRLFAIGVEPDISLLADVSVEIFLRMQEAATAVPFTEAMADLFADGLLGQPALQSIAAGIEQFVVDEEQRRGVPVKMASTVGTLQGVVTQGIKGSPEPNVTVVLTQGGLEVDSMSTGANGEFTFVDVPRGQATVFVESAPANRVNTTVVATATVTADIDLAFILSNVMSIALGAGGNFIMIDSDFQAIFRADPFGQLISEISSVSRGEGPILQSPSQIAVEPDGNLVVTDSFTGSVVRVNPNTGDRIIVSNPGLGVGLGPRFASTSNSNIRAPGITVQADGTIWLAGIVLPANDEARPAVLRVNSDNGDRTIVSDAATGAGPNFETLFDIAVMESTGQLVVSDQSLNAIIVVDPANGNRTILSDMTIGDDPFLEAVLKSTYL